ncbi:mitogen-activated protein kinase kinase kinase 17-like [Lolium rigidum]|uniref:mitogen-activated protein kinase kinase kinase 17-like n=1 Tax=Lolium rigidum TaxID=89674 RepID=UPI001F5D4E7C|nr:mitogen-activated protein kinase kinase kinase 17-like [Lolium rigidum]
MGVGEWTRGPTIGRGSSATVSLAVDRLTGELLAVKSVGADRAAELRREQSILGGLSSPYVVRCLGSEVSASSDGSGGCDMLMEYAPGGSLADEIRQRRGGRCEESLIRSRARDILRGLAHAHAAGVAHCDVKARNVLIGADGRAMIADFGCARRIAGQRLAVGGTPAFMSPEAARGEAQGPAADVWALGCTVIEMATGAAPWQRFGSPVAMLHHVASSGEAPEVPLWLSEEGKDFLGRCLLQDAGERWTAEQLLEHEFLAFDAAVSSSISVAGITTQKGMFVSPKSVLDQAFWKEDDDDTTADTVTAGPIDRVRGLAAGAPDWTWDASWITVHSSGPSSDYDDDEEELAMYTDTDSDSPVGGSSTTSVGSSNSQASHANCDRYDDRSSCNGERGDYGDHGINDCTFAITSNGFFSDMLLFDPAGCPILPFRLLRCAEASKFRYAPLADEDKMREIFEQHSVTNEYARVPIPSSQVETSHINVLNDDDSGCEEVTPTQVLGKGGKKRACPYSPSPTLVKKVAKVDEEKTAFTRMVDLFAKREEKRNSVPSEPIMTVDPVKVEFKEMMTMVVKAGGLPGSDEHFYAS